MPQNIGGRHIRGERKRRLPLLGTEVPENRQPRQPGRRNIRRQGVGGIAAPVAAPVAPVSPISPVLTRQLGGRGLRHRGGAHIQGRRRRMGEVEEDVVRRRQRKSNRTHTRRF